MAGGGPRNYMESSQLAVALIKHEELSIYSHPIRGRMRRIGVDRSGSITKLVFCSSTADCITTMSSCIFISILGTQTSPCYAIELDRDSWRGAEWSRVEQSSLV